MSTISTNLYDSNEAMVLKRRAIAMGLDPESALLMISGNTQPAADQIGLELGINKSSDEHNLSFDRFVRSSTSDSNYLMQGEDGMLTDLNFDAGTVSQQSVEEFAEENGLIEDGDKFYDVVDFGQDEAHFIDYAFEGTGDADPKPVEIQLGNKDWQSISWVRQEVDQTTWGSGAKDPVSVASNEAFAKIYKHRNQWLKATDIANLQRCKTFEEYLEKLAEYAVETMDETGENEY